MPCKLSLNISRPGEVFVLSPHPHSYVIVYDFFSGLARTLIGAGGQGQVPPPSRAPFGRGEMMNPRLICCDRRGRVLVMESRGQMRLLVFSATGAELGCFQMQDFFEFPSAMITWPPAHPTFSINDCLSQAATRSSNGSVLPGAATQDDDELILIADHRLNLVHAFDYTGSLQFSISGDGVRVSKFPPLPPANQSFSRVKLLTSTYFTLSYCTRPPVFTLIVYYPYIP